MEFGNNVPGHGVPSCKRMDGYQKVRSSWMWLGPQVVETDDVLEIVWHIPLNANASKITKVERYMKDGSIVEGLRRDGRPGVLRSQLTFSQDGTPHIRFVYLSRASF